ncbi:MAG: acyl carrier protein [Pirellulales bacterium]|jgi:acyl carrier protein
MPSTAEIRQRVENTFVNVLKVQPAELGDDRRIREDLGADSLDAVTLVMALEDEFGRAINDAEALSLATVGDVVAFISRQVEGQSLA